MTSTRTELAYDILIKLTGKVSNNIIVRESFAIADEFLEEVKRHDSKDEVVFDEHK